MAKNLILVTGGAGFIGSHISEALIAAGYAVRVLDNFVTGHRENLKTLQALEQFELIEGDVGDLATVLAASQGACAIYHEAALVSVPLSIQQPAASFQNNAQGVFNVFEAARQQGVKTVIYASSAAVYGDNQELPLPETTTCQPLSPYALDKYYAEQLATLYAQLYGIHSVGLRYFNVYGPRQDPSSPYSGVISIFLERLQAQQDIVIYGDGEQTRDFIYVQDVVAANLKALTLATGAQVFNVGRQQVLSINTLLQMLQTITGKSASKITYQAAKTGDIRHSCANIQKITQEFNWQADYSMQQGLETYIRSL
ncbi:NAD-dependent epimerase/dehydratase family protein [Candidatus Venteria ishoeyi]|uniref:UDP-glucose 4-epimerase n=2 Tax=Candidatus Venteria ishoeyi TaxID=1899563 RepID=A0A1H6F873_9GAMM|nr:NAD-dependent epimerase/dehydratase family protein [Candidatus Venteria ishoeyi]SEH05763.1 UDP-glucose 4-epimerase [Candidatus Venteria ishoeyi]